MRHNAFRLSVALVTTLALASGCRSSTSTQSPSPAGGGDAAKNAMPAKPAAVTPANVTLGDSLFNNGGCKNCHGVGGVGGANAPTLDGKAWIQLKTGGFDEIVGIIVSGVPADKIKDPKRTRAMQARGGRMALTDPQIQAVAAYVYTLTHK